MSATDGRIRRLRVLVVDDNGPLVRVIARQMNTARPEWDVRTCTRPTQALAMLECFDADVLLVDFQMPGMDGLELLAVVEGIRPGLPAIVHSASVPPAGRPASRWPWMAKPCHVADLVLAIERVCLSR